MKRKVLEDEKIRGFTVVVGETMSELRSVFEKLTLGKRGFSSLLAQ